MRRTERQATPARGRDQKSLDFLLKSLRKVSILSAEASGRQVLRAARIKKVSILAEIH